MKAYRGNRGIAPLILDHGTKWTWVINFTPRSLYLRKNHGTHLIRGWVGPRAGINFWRRETFLAFVPPFGFRMVQTNKRTNSLKHYGELKAALIIDWGNRDRYRTSYSFLRALQGLNMRPTRHTAGNSFDIQFPCQTFDSVTPVTNVTAAMIHRHGRQRLLAAAAAQTRHPSHSVRSRDLGDREH